MRKKNIIIVKKVKWLKEVPMYDSRFGGSKLPVTENDFSK